MAARRSTWGRAVDRCPPKARKIHRCVVRQHACLRVLARDLTGYVCAHGVPQYAPQYVLLPTEVWERVARVLNAVDDAHSNAAFRNREALSQTQRAVKTPQSAAEAIEWIQTIGRATEGHQEEVERLKAEIQRLEWEVTLRPPSPKIPRTSE